MANKKKSAKKNALFIAENLSKKGPWIGTPPRGKKLEFFTEKPPAKKYKPYDVIPFGPSFFNQPKKRPFFITPNIKEDQNWPAVASDGKSYFIVWTQKAYQTHLWGARLTSQGKVLDSGGFLINVGGFHRFPRVAFGKDPKTGKGYYLVVWQRYESSSKRHSVHGALVSTDAKIIVHEASMQPDAKAKYGFSPSVQTLKGTKAVNSDGIHIFPDIKDHWNKWQEYGPWDSFGPPDVAFNGKDFVVVSGGVARLVEPGTGKVKREKPKNTVVYPLGKPITIKIANWKKSCYSVRIVSGGKKECLVTWVDGPTKPRVSELWGVKVTFSGSSWTIGKPKLISSEAEAPYGRCETATDGSGGYLLAWHDMTHSQKKKTKPYHKWAPDLFRAHISSPKGKPMQFSMTKWGPLYMKREFDSYYPHVAFDGSNYVVIWDSGGTYLKQLWMVENLGATWVDPETWPQWEFWDFVDSATKKKLTKALSCMNDFTLLGSYLSPQGYPVENFGILSRDYGPGYYGLIGHVGDVCFGKSEGLLVYRWINTDAWDLKHPQYMIRARFLAKSYPVLSLKKKWIGEIVPPKWVAKVKPKK